MIQTLLPIFPTELTLINNLIGFQRKDGQVYYFNGMMPIYCHREDDLAGFRFVTAQMAVLGNATQAEIVRAFGISTISMKRWVKRYKEKGAAGFFAKRRGRGQSVLFDEVVEEIQDQLDNGKGIPEIAAERDLKADTLNKAVRDGRLIKRKKN